MTSFETTLRIQRNTKSNFILIALICISEPFASTMLLPFVYFMVKGFGYEETGIGYRAGLITSAFFIVQMFTAPAWCILSDRIGRKPCLIFGLFGTAIGMVLFGLSRSLTWAIITRSFCGLVNGNLAIARTMVGELADISSVEKGKAFSIFGFCLAIGWMIGPLVGGSLADPYNSIGISGPGGAFEKFPWLLPCIFSAAFCTIVGTLAIVYLDETRGVALLPVPKNAAAENFVPDFDGDECEPLLTSSHGRDKGYSTASKSSIDISNGSGAGTNFRLGQALILLSSMFFFTHLIFYDELFALFAASNQDKGTGLSFTSQDIARTLAFAGPAMLLALVAFSTLHRRFNSLALYRASSLVFILVYPTVSLLPQLGTEGKPRILLWIALISLVVVRYAAMVIGLAGLQILFNDIVRPRDRAIMNGLGQSIGSLARAIGPSLGGFTWSWGLESGKEVPLDFHTPFVLLLFLGISQAVLTAGIPKQSTIDEAIIAWKQEEEEQAGGVGQRVAA